MWGKWKLNVKSLGKNCQVLKDLESGLSNKEVAKNKTKQNVVFYYARTIFE